MLVSFHSLEDKIIKFFFKSLSENKKISRYMPEYNHQSNLIKLEKKKPIYPSEYEIKTNRPSRSAKLRYGIKINYMDNFEKGLVEKFSKLLEIEKLSHKL